jgi:uncharacterized membrane protein (UPF0182 family)
MRRNFVVVVLGSVLALLILLPALVRFGASWLWFGEIGFRTVLSTEILTRTLLFLVAAGLAFAVLYANLRLAQRYQRPVPALTGDITELVQRLPAHATARLAAVGVVVLSLFIGSVVSSGWLTLLQFLHGVPFGAADPVLGRDVGYYVYRLPVISGILALLVTLTVLALGLAAATYFTSGDIGFTPHRKWMTRPAAVHVSALLAVFFVLAALQIWLVGIPGLLFASTGPFSGASFTDVTARRPGLHASAVAALGAAALVLVGLFKRRIGPYVGAAVALYAGVSALGRAAIPALVQRLVVAPTELTREGPFLANHITATRNAWGLDSVQTRDVRAEQQALTIADIRENAATIENVRLWDRDPLLQTFGQIQEIRTYYDFVSVDDDRYWIDGRYRQVHLSPRELNSASLPTRRFINEHLTFTHGMGLTLAPVNQVTAEGLPVLFVKDLPPASSVSLTITRPQIYFGELTSSYAIVKSRQREFDYPAGDDNVYTSYQGTGGVPVGGFFRRSMLAWHFRSLRLLLSGDITSDSRILFRRGIMERASAALPFLRFDRDPYLVISDSGQLKWVLDAYTSTRRYPYSQPVSDGTTYMRNSVKVVIDAYHGSVRAYVSEPGDPLVRTWERVFPGTLVPLDSMPADLRTHLRYPEDLFRVQAGLYATYHMTEPEEFYHREDQWQVPVLGQDGQESAFMRRIVMRLPDEEREEFIFMSPFTPRGKDNLAAWMVARNDGEQYGRLRVYRFPRQSLVFGPQQVVNRMNQDPAIAREISLWDQRGSEVIRGALMVIPIEGSLIYVQPLYLRAQGGRIPELKRVIAAYENRVVMDSTLDLGLARLFGGPLPAPVITDEELGTATAPGDATTAALLSRARQHFDRAMEAQRAGNWALYGTEIERLGALLRQLGGPRPP